MSTMLEPLVEVEEGAEAHAESRGVGDVFRHILASVPRLFPTFRSLRVYLQHDPEIKDYTFIVFQLRLALGCARQSCGQEALVRRLPGSVADPSRAVRPRPVGRAGMNPRDFHSVAQEFAEGETEAHWRSAITRAYYAAFLVGRQVLIRCGFRVPRADGAHTYVIWRLSNAGVAEVRDAGTDLDILRSFRNQADYETGLNVAQWEAEARVETAREIIDALDDALTDPTILATITQAMRDYERDTLGVVTWRA